MHDIVNIFFFLSSDHSKGFGGKYGVLKDHQDEVKKKHFYTLYSMKMKKLILLIFFIEISIVEIKEV